jgi:hypothetical protein
VKPLMYLLLYLSILLYPYTLVGLGSKNCLALLNPSLSLYKLVDFITIDKCLRVLRENPRETVFPRGILPLGTYADMHFPTRV